MSFELGFRWKTTPNSWQTEKHSSNTSWNRSLPRSNLSAVATLHLFSAKGNCPEVAFRLPVFLCSTNVRGSSSTLLPLLLLLLLLAPWYQKKGCIWGSMMVQSTPYVLPEAAFWLTLPLCITSACGSLLLLLPLLLLLLAPQKGFTNSSRSGRDWGMPCGHSWPHTVCWYLISNASNLQQVQANAGLWIMAMQCAAHILNKLK